MMKSMLTLYLGDCRNYISSKWKGRCYLDFWWLVWLGVNFFSASSRPASVFFQSWWKREKKFKKKRALYRPWLIVVVVVAAGSPSDGYGCREQTGGQTHKRLGRFVTWLVNITLAAAKRGGRIKKDITVAPFPLGRVINHSPGGTGAVLVLLAGTHGLL